MGKTMNIQKYIAFVKAVEYGNITKAAEALNYTQSAVSRIISDLELEWGIILIERRRTGIVLTPEGLKIFPQIKQVCMDHELLLRQIEEIQDIQLGTVRIGTISSIATHWLPDTIKKFKKDYPKIEFELLLGDYLEIEKWIAEGRVDFGFLRLPTIHHFETVSLLKDRLLVVIPETHPLATSKSFPIAVLADNPFMLLEKGGKAEISELLEAYDIVPDVHFTTWDDYVIMAMIEKGLGISILPELILQRIPYKIVAKELEIPAFRKLGIAMRNKQALTLAARKFLEYVPRDKMD